MKKDNGKKAENKTDRSELLKLLGLDKTQYLYDEMTEMDDHVTAHAHSSHHRAEIENSQMCGCFYCLKTFPPFLITLWWDDPEGTPEFLQDALGVTATCPNCGIDAVIGSASGYPITDEFLLQMSNYWFGGPRKAQES